MDLFINTTFMRNIKYGQQNQLLFHFSIKIFLEILHKIFQKQSHVFVMKAIEEQKGIEIFYRDDDN